MLYDILSILDEEKLTVLFLKELEGGIFPLQDDVSDVLASEIVVVLRHRASWCVHICQECDSSDHWHGHWHVIHVVPRGHKALSQGR